jgi:hypothetical protein
MRYDHFTMLPERAFQPIAGRMTLEGGGGGKGGGSAPPPPAPPPPPKQQEKPPEADVYRGKNQAAQEGGMSAGPSSTLLTGPEGVDPNSLELGKSTLLGG